MPRSNRYWIQVAMLVSLGSAAQAETWSQFRGATGFAVSGERGRPTRWSTEQGIMWQIELPGRGNASPAVIRDR